MDFEEAGLLEGLEGDERAARDELLRHLSESGFSLEELQEAVREDRLALLPVERVMSGGELLTVEEVAERSGVDTDLLRAVRRGLGLPGADERVYTEADAEAARAIRMFLDAGIPEEEVLAITRVLGQGSYRLAAAVNRAFGQAFLRAGDTERDLAQRYEEAAEQLGPAIPPILVSSLSAHLRELLRRAVVGQAERSAGRLNGAANVSVAFADLVGFTRLGRDVPAEELGSVAAELERLTLDVIEPPVHLVKTLGDAVMLVSTDPPQLVQVLIDLVDRVGDDEELPELRAGAAHGPALPRGGDWYGHTVNLASRITGVARPGSVLVSEELAERAGPGVALSRAGRHRLKGVKGPTTLLRARTATSD